MITALDVAAYITQKLGAMSAMKLQKLVYYTQAWSLIWDDRPLFADRVEAWANGPVLSSLYALHKGLFEVDAVTFQSGHAEHLDSKAIETVNSVLQSYGDKDTFWLSELTHSESPWKDARSGLQPGERGSREIPLAAMAEY